jgi:Domain of unknown function (DUF1844)
MSDEIEAALQGSGDDDELDSRPELPPADFDFLVYSLRLQAELNLGLLPFGAVGQEPGDEDPGPDFELARHNIDLLAMLQQKTKGNLTAEEQSALDNSLTELRFRFVQSQHEEPRQEESKPQ